jgi:hypothetical protein
MTDHYNDPDAKIAELNRHIRVLEDLTEYNDGGTDEIAGDVQRLADEVSELRQALRELADCYNKLVDRYAVMVDRHHELLVETLPKILSAALFPPVKAGAVPQPGTAPASEAPS